MIGSKRQQKFSRMILKEISDIFQRSGSKFTNGQFVTISDVTVTPDLREARIYISMSLVKDRKALIEYIHQHEKEIRHQLGNRIRNQVKEISDLKFFVDELQEKAARIDELLDSLFARPGTAGDGSYSQFAP